MRCLVYRGCADEASLQKPQKYRTIIRCWLRSSGASAAVSACRPATRFEIDRHWIGRPERRAVARIPANRDNDRGLSGFDARRRFACRRSWELPFGAHKRYLSNAADFDAPANAINGPKFGVVSTTGQAREIRFCVKVHFLNGAGTRRG
jgi:hypothetical protein